MPSVIARTVASAIERAGTASYCFDVRAILLLKFGRIIDTALSPSSHGSAFENIVGVFQGLRRLLLMWEELIGFGSIFLARNVWSYNAKKEQFIFYLFLHCKLFVE